jgi:nitrogen fixation protein FixH
MTAETRMNNSVGRAPTYRWIPWAIVGAFVFVAMVNGALAYFAIHSDPGLVSDHPFELGNGYNRILDAGAAQDALGWRAEARFQSGDGLSGKVVVLVSGPSGAPVDGLTVKLAVVRPVDALPEQDLALAAVGGGRYEAPIALARAGQWDLQVAAARGDLVYRFAQRIVAQ